MGVVLLGLLADLLLAEGRTKKTVKGVFGLITLLVIIAPLSQMIKSGQVFQGGLLGGTVTADVRYLDTITKAQLTELSKAAQKELEGKGYKDVNVTFSALGQSITLVYVDLSGAGTDMWKKYAEVRTLVAKYLKIEEGAVVVYG